MHIQADRLKFKLAESMPIWTTHRQQRTDGRAGGNTYGQADRQTDRRTDGQTDRQTDGQTGRQRHTDAQTHRHTADTQKRKVDVLTGRLQQYLMVGGTKSNQLGVATPVSTDDHSTLMTAIGNKRKKINSSSAQTHGQTHGQTHRQTQTDTDRHTDTDKHTHI